MASPYCMSSAVLLLLLLSVGYAPAFDMFIEEGVIKAIVGTNFGKTRFNLVRDNTLDAATMTQLNNIFQLENHVLTDAIKVIANWSNPPAENSNVLYSFELSSKPPDVVQPELKLIGSPRAGGKLIAATGAVPIGESSLLLNMVCKKYFPVPVEVQFHFHYKVIQRPVNTSSKPHLKFLRNCSNGPMMVTTPQPPTTSPSSAATERKYGTTDSTSHSPNPTSTAAMSVTVGTPTEQLTAVAGGRSSGSSSTPLLAVIAGGAACAILLTIIIACLVIARRRRQHKSPPIANTGLEGNLQIQNKHGTDSSQGLCTLKFDASPTWSTVTQTHGTPMTQVSHLSIGDQFTIDFRDLQIGRLLGKGAFGVVYEGHWHGEHVAVKTIKGGSEEEVAKFLEEARHMKDFNHPNVLSLVGISVQNNGLPQIVVPFMGGGDLLTYLRTHDPTVTSGSQNLDDLTLVSIAIQAAQGMLYLANKSFVHRDLAARNCMLTEDLIVKVGDFGLGRDLDEGSYYKISSEWRLPVRWMSIESLQFHKFSTQSDVWSYGVLLWEIFTSGQIPYTGIQNQHVPNYLLAGKRLRKPHRASEGIYELMSDCWLYLPSHRPTFKQILTRLQDADPPAYENVMNLSCYSNLPSPVAKGSITTP